MPTAGTGQRARRITFTAPSAAPNIRAPGRRNIPGDAGNVGTARDEIVILHQESLRHEESAEGRRSPRHYDGGVNAQQETRRAHQCPLDLQFPGPSEDDDRCNNEIEGHQDRGQEACCDTLGAALDLWNSKTGRDDLDQKNEKAYSVHPQEVEAKHVPYGLTPRFRLLGIGEAHGSRPSPGATSNAIRGVAIFRYRHAQLRGTEAQANAPGCNPRSERSRAALTPLPGVWRPAPR